MGKNFLELSALKVSQPLGDFFVISITAEKLLEICFSEPLKYIDNTGKVQGSQRIKDERRLKEIATYIESVEMAFPNSIILSANYNENGQIIQDKNVRWRIIENKDTYKLIIPKQQKLAAIIDGQHRLGAFRYVGEKEKLKNINLVCSVYFDLPNSYQAFLFATINSNQKSVNRSLALEQFGYNVDDESEKAWTPEKFAVFLSRKLNTDKLSPFYRHIKVAPMNAEKLFDGEKNKEWVVSTATIVDGITSLISANPKRDRILMQQKSFLNGRSRSMIENIKDNSPLRNYFLSIKDQQIYDIIICFFNSVNNYLWVSSNQNSYIKKTVGVQALFDVLKVLLRKENINLPIINFDYYIEQIKNIDFGDKFFQSSGIGRGRIRNTISIRLGLISLDKIKGKDRDFYERVLENSNSNYEPEKWMCEEDAENAIVNTLEAMIWNYDSKTVTIINDNDFDKLTQIKNLDSLIQKLEEIGELEFYASAPADEEIRNLIKERFNIENIVQSSLLLYNDNLVKIGWI